MNDIVDRAADRIAQTSGRSISHRHAKALVKMVISSMREPTAEMIGTAGLLSVRIAKDGDVALLGADNADLAWKYMIDRLLK